jgi:hypothetical protein
MIYILRHIETDDRQSNSIYVHAGIATKMACLHVALHHAGFSVHFF